MIGYQFDNETKPYGTSGPAVQARFVPSMKAKWPSLDALNQAWGLNYWANRINRWGAGSARAPAYLSASMRLLACPALRRLFAGAVMTGLAAAPFYAFAAPYLIRTHGFSAT